MQCDNIDNRIYGYVDSLRSVTIRTVVFKGMSVVCRVQQYCSNGFANSLWSCLNMNITAGKCDEYNYLFSCI